MKVTKKPQKLSPAALIVSLPPGKSSGQTVEETGGDCVEKREEMKS